MALKTNICLSYLNQTNYIDYFVK
ncbi:CLUMA_CG006290, isoform A [Clunio marinus]|uniref:CLUMA_CG006290, isoform A n=1 Tax=Clunio marinus TaxID=568069 RepID=A0A1J1I1H8_9DIPT|nr:CLUMA_CG006290, isoform A [Clunio marinus]